MSRRMFVLLNTTLQVSSLSDTRSHAEWFYDRKWSFAMSECVRGYFDSQGIYMYQKSSISKWDFTEQVLNKAQMIVWLLQENKKAMPWAFEVLENGLPVYGGLFEGPKGTKWKPRIKLDPVFGEVLGPK